MVVHCVHCWSIAATTPTAILFAIRLMNNYCSHCLGKYCMEDQTTAKMEQEWTSGERGSERDHRMQFSTRPQTVPRASLPRTNAMRKRRGEAMSNASVVVHSSFTPLIFVTTGGMRRQPMLHTEDWCQCWRGNEISHTVS